MNDKITKNTNGDENIARKLNQVADETNINAKFASELEERLRNARRPKVNWFTASFKQVSPTLRWVGLVLLLGLVLNWSIKSLIPAPQPATDNTLTPEVTVDDSATPAPDSGGYDWRGTKLYLAAPLPTSPTEASVYLLKADQQATVEEVRMLAQRFGIEGEVYIAPYDTPSATDYLVTDGKQRLFVQSENHFTYYADYGNPFLGSKKINQNEANVFIEAFLKSHGFNFEYQIEKDFRIAGVYYVVPLTLDGFAMRNDYNLPIRIEIALDDNGQVFRMQSSLINYDVVRKFGIRSAEEAFNQLFNETQIGLQENFLSGGTLNENNWQRIYPDNQTITIYGHVTSYPSIESGKAPFLEIDALTVNGNISGLEDVDPSTFVEASGQFHIEDEIRKFNIESWKVSDATPMYIIGTLRREDDQIILTTDDGNNQYTLTDVPADVPLNTKIPDEQLSVVGVLVDGNFQWFSIQYLPPGSNFGGGGGGGTGFYQLNLSGTPVPFPNPTAHPATNQGSGEYIVKEGDTLIMIAQNLGITVDELMQVNGLSDPMIFIGQKLIIPGAQSSSESVQYIVKEGDTVFAIAEAYGITPEKIIQANDWLSEEHALMPGKMLIIPDPQVDPSPVGQRIEGLRGTLAITIYKKPDGGQRIEYILNPKSGETSLTPMLLEGDNLQDLLSNQARPLDIWGTLDHYDNDGRPVVKVERYEIPYPDLQIQLFQGTQENISLDGQIVTMFTSNDGQKYVLLYPNGDLDETTIDPEKPQLILEAMAVPNESFFGYPTLRFFGGGFAIDPMTGKLAEFSVTADQPYVIDEVTTPENYTPPTATIEKVELVYYTPNPLGNNTNVGVQYIQPAWRFYGHYGNGDEFEFLVQALKQEYLLPELAPYTPPG